METPNLVGILLEPKDSSGEREALSEKRGERWGFGEPLPIDAHDPVILVE